jgi:gliding motility-associated-like protein
VLNTYNITENFDVCSGNDYTYPDGTTSTNITVNESHVSNLLSVAGCDSIITTNINVLSTYAVNEAFSVCSGASYTYPDGTISTNITVNESHVSNLTSVAGCDSIVTTDISVISAYNTSENVSVCPGSNYTYPDGTVSTNIMANESHVSNLLSVLGCDSIVTTNVSLYPVYNETENVSACEGSTYTYPDGTNEVITGNTSHVSTLSTIQGCDSIVTTNVTMDPLPNAGIDGAITLCINDPSTDLFNEIGGSPPTGGTWSPALASGSGIFDPAVDAPGVYTYQVTNGCGTDDATVTVTVDPLQDASFSYSSNSYCSNDLNPAAVITGVPGGTFTIDNGGVIDPSTGEININASGVGNFTVTYTTPGPCQNSSTVTISIIQQADASITQVGPFCEYDDSLYLETVEAGGTWSGPGVDPVTGVFDPAQANIGVNTITYTIGGPCGDSQSIDIEVFPTPTVNTIPNATIDLGSSIVLNTTSNASTYSWSPDIWLSCNDCLSPTATPEDNVTYEITVEENGCIATDYVSIVVEYDPVIFVPNIFSPNGDNNNDVLYVRGLGVDYMIFYVYDRWGEKVFESTALENGWDGTFRGKPMNPGVFVYYVEATFLNGTTSTLKGDVTLIR